GAVVPGAQVVAKNKSTDLSRTTASSDTGDYRFELLPVGNYTITISKSGFATFVQTLEILVGQTATVNAQLKPGVATELIEVTGAAPLVDQAKTDEFRGDRKSTRLNSSHLVISYAVFC